MIVYRNDYSNEQLNIISALAERFEISFKLAKILFSRGIDSERKMQKFLNPGKHNFYNPYLLKGMKESVERITYAREMQERILVFGDYDADGIFLDIVGVIPCYCSNCIRTLREEGKDPSDEAAVLELAERTYANYARKCREAIDSVKPGLPLFHNAGHIREVNSGKSEFAERSA